MKLESQFIRENIQALTDAKGRELVAILKEHRSFDVPVMLLADLYLKALETLDPPTPVNAYRCMVKVGHTKVIVFYDVIEGMVIVFHAQVEPGNGVQELIETSRWKQLVSDVEKIAHKEGCL